MGQKRTQYLLLIAICIGLNIVGSYVYQQWDLTEDKRYTLTKPTQSMLSDLEEIIFVQVLLDGDLPAGFKRLRESTRDILNEFRQTNGLIDYQFEDPQKGTVQEMNDRAKELAKDGIIPTRLRIRDKGEATEKLIYPYALVYFGNRMYPVNLLENERPGVDNEWILNTSIGLLEYKLANAIVKIKQAIRPNIVLTTGHGELAQSQTAFLERELGRHYNTGRLHLDSVIRISDEIDMVIVPKPVTPFSDKELFVLDQYVINGGNVLFLVDQLNIALDSLSQTKSYIPQAYDLNLAPLLFKYGARINPDLVLDLECTRIPLVVGKLGERVQTELFPWYYHPLVAPSGDHVLTKNIDRINLQFPSSLDTVRTKANIKKQFLIRSSEYARIQRIPTRINFEILRYEPKTEEFDQGGRPMAVLLEGEQLSLFENRVNDAMQEQLRSVGAEFKVQAKPSKIVVVSDGDLIKNIYNRDSGEFSEIGYNKFENFVFEGNQSFIFNTIEYMMDDSGILASRSKEVKLRMLDTVNATENAIKWQLLNIVVPLILMILAVLSFNWWRRRRFST